MLLTVDKVTKTYPGQSRAVLHNVSFELAAGQSLSLTGESGSGKSTLLHLLGALDRADTGHIRFANQELSALSDAAAARLRRTRIALVFQQFNLVPALTVAENISLHARLGQRQDPAWVKTLTQRLGLQGLEKRYPEQISGGQQQRVAIGRALALRPDLLLADEPTGNLDETASAEVMALMLQMVRETGAALFMVTHSRSVAAQTERHLHLRDGAITEGAL